MAKRLSVIHVDRCVGCQLCIYACARREGHAGTEGARIDVRSAGGMRRGFVVIVCRACDDPPCARACTTGALVPRDGGGVRVVAGLCTDCGACCGACPFGAIQGNRDGLPLVCVYCGTCARYCPHDVLALEEIKGRNDAAR
jgi:carbon-monoxide dehydrogenase iron sulfur subunit